MKVNIGDYQPENYIIVQLEGPTAYLMNDFSLAYRMDRRTGDLTEIDKDAGEGVEGLDPVIISTEDQQYALGACAVTSPPVEPGIPGLRYGYFHFPGITRFTDRTWKWSVVYRTGPMPPNTILDYHSYVCVGDLDMTADCMKKALGIPTKTVL